MFAPQDHIVVCHGCGAFHVLRTSFLSSPMAIGFESTMVDGRSWAVPCRACPTCHAIKTATRDEHPIARAFDHGMAAESRARANREFAETWERRLEARAGR